MSQWKGKSRGGVLGHKIFVFVLKNLGIKPAYFVLRFVAAYYWLFAKSSSRPALSYFQNRLGYDKGKARRALYQNYSVFGRTLLDKVAILAGAGDKYSYYMDGVEHLRDIAAKGKGGILISAHMGNWEIAGHFLKDHVQDASVNVIMQQAEHEQIKSYLDKETGHRGFKVIAVKEDMSHIFEISSALKNNELICIHGDRFVEGARTVEKTFLGAKAEFPAGPFSMAAKFGVPVSFVFAMKEEGLHYHFFATKGKVYGRKEADTIVQDYVDQLEGMVKRYPEQWFNFYDFWK